MADTKDYLTVYKRFFDNFAKTVDPDDQLPVRVAGYRLWDNEIVGETVDWTLQYLSQRDCPAGLLAPITRIVIDEINEACQTQPLALGYKPVENCYLPLKLMQAVTNKVNEVCLRFCDNGKVASLPPPLQGPLLSSCAIKNSRRCMEDRHVILEDFHAFYNIKDASTASYYGVFDGHAGSDAAVYSVSHLHQFLAESPFYPKDPESAIKDAFFRTDKLFIEKSNKENLRSGTTAVCALLRQKEKKLHVAWLGDSQAILVRNGQIMNLVNPHKPERQDERNRIHGLGGTVLYWGTWRVNGQLAVSRAIGDLSYKPYVTAEPDVRTVDLNGDEDFLILACDGLWDFVSAEDVAHAVTKQLMQNPADLVAVSQKLVQLSKQQGSTDNITVIVAFLTDPSVLAARARHEAPRFRAPNGPSPFELPQPSAPMMETFDLSPNNGPTPLPAAVAAAEADLSAPAVPAAAAATTNPFEADLAASKVAAAAAAAVAGAEMLLDFGQPKDDPFQIQVPFNNGHTNGNLYDFLERSPNGKALSAGAVDDEDDDSDGLEQMEQEQVDGGKLSPSSLLSKNNPFGADLELQRQQTSEFDADNEPRHDTPTPPADEVPGVIGLVSDNVAESGEESEDEWNYYRVDPSEKPQEPAVKEQQAKPEVCSEQALNVDELDENMESQLNPNAAEFIPSPTHSKPSMEEILLKGKPSETDSILNTTVSDVKTDDLLETKEENFDKNKAVISTSEKKASVNPLAADTGVNVEKSVDNGVTCTLNSSFNESSAYSTKAEFGDESTCDTEFQKILDSSSSIMESSFIEQNVASEEQTSDVTINSTEVIEQSVFQQDIVSDFQKEPVHISFELRKEIAPQMESQPERVKVDSEDQSPTLDSEQELQLTNELIENKISENIDFLQSDDISDNLNAEFTDFKEVKEQISQISEVDRMEGGITEKIDFENISMPSEVDFLKEVDSKPSIPGDNILDFTQSVEKSGYTESGESPALFVQNDIQGIDKLEESSQISESPLSELTDELPVQQSHQLISNEISTPEYEKLEKDLEASEQYHNQLNITKNDIPVDIAPVNESNFGISTDIPLESAHPDKVALLDDAFADPGLFDAKPMESVRAVDFSYSNGPLTVSASGPAPDLLESLCDDVPSSATLASTGAEAFEYELMPENVPVVDVQSTISVEPLPFETETLGSPVEAALQSNSVDLLSETSEEPAHIPVQDISSCEPPVEIEQMEDVLTPQSPTPLTSQLTKQEDLSFNRSTGDFEEVVGKLSANREGSEEKVLQATDVAFEAPADVSLIQQTEDDTSVLSPSQAVVAVEVETMLPVTEEPVTVSSESEPLPELSSVAVVAGGVAVAAAGTAAAFVASSNKDIKKEKEAPAKKASLTPKDKKPGVEKPKTTAKTTVPSRLTATTTKPKSPTSPVKPPVTSKTAPPRPSQSAAASKPLAKPPVTKTASRPLSSTQTRTTPTPASKLKPTATAPTTKSPTTGLTKTRPASSTLEKKTVANGDIKTAPKRPEQLATKTTASRLSTTRPASAPATKTVNKTTSSVTSTLTKTKPALNGPSKSKPITQVRSVAKVSSEKEIKETANKQISTRTTTSTVRSTTTTTAASKPSVTSAPRKIESKVLTNGKIPSARPSSLVKTSTTAASRVAPKKPATTTRLKTTKTESIVQKSETVQGSKTVIATTE